MPKLKPNSVVPKLANAAEDAATDITLLRQTLADLADEMRDRIDGATDGPAIDGWLSEWIRTIEWALGETR